MKQIGNFKLFTVDELAQLLDVQERTIREYLKAGTLRGRKMAGRWYIPEEAVKDYFRETATAPADEQTASGED